MKIIVDLFNQHSGDMDELKKLALSAYLNGADAPKIQVFTSELVWGDDRKKYLEMTYSQVKNYYEFCKKNDIKFLATAFDEEKVEWLDDLGAESYKIASITAKKNPELCEKILSKNKETIISLGFFERDVFPYGHDKNIKYLYCIPEYPTYLYNKKLKQLPDTFGENGYYGYSDHVIGSAAALKAYLNGAKMLEKHYTFNCFAQAQEEKAHLGAFDPSSLRQFKNLIKEFEAMK